jgi:hypothetical protein
MSAATLEPKPPANGLPVFVANGRRRYRAVQLAKVALGLALAGWLAALCASLIGFAPLPLPALSGSDDGHAVSAVRPQSPAPASVGDGTRRGASDGASGGKSSTAGRSRGDAPRGGGAARSTAGTNDTSARTQPPTADVGHNGSSSNPAGSPKPTSPEPSAQPPPEAPAPTSTAPTSTTPVPSNSTSSPDQPASTSSPDGGGGTTSQPAPQSTTTTGTTSEPASQATTTTPDTPASGTLPG